jgi:hypothetical protein
MRRPFAGVDGREERPAPYQRLAICQDIGGGGLDCTSGVNLARHRDALWTRRTSGRADGSEAEDLSGICRIDLFLVFLEGAQVDAEDICVASWRRTQGCMRAAAQSSIDCLKKSAPVVGFVRRTQHDQLTRYRILCESIRTPFQARTAEHTCHMRASELVASLSAPRQFRLPVLHGY